MSAQEQVIDTCLRIKHNRETFNALKYLVEQEQAAGMPRVSRDNIFSIAQRRHIEIGNTDKFKRDHNLWSVIARYIILLNPETSKVLQCRKSPIDNIDLDFYWERLVDENTCFEAHTVEQAKLLVA